MEQSCPEVVFVLDLIAPAQDSRDQVHESAAHLEQSPADPSDARQLLSIRNISRRGSLSKVFERPGSVSGLMGLLKERARAKSPS